MKTAVFITSPEKAKLAPKAAETRESEIYNSKKRPFLAGEGLMAVRCEFPYRGGDALLRSTALGIYDLFINGVRVGRRAEGESETVYDELKPGWTDYSCRVFEDEYDISDLCKIGENTFVAVVSGGWWLGRISFGYYGAQNCAFCAEIEENLKIIAATGKKKKWQTSYGGRIRTADIWDGEYYDATQPDIAAFPKRYKWSDAVLFDTPCFILPRVGSGVVVRKRMGALAATLWQGSEKSDTVYGKIKVLYEKTGAGCERVKLEAGQALILDFGQNIAGRPKISLRASRGTAINIYFAEMLNDSGDPKAGSDGPKGSLYMANYRSALSRITYIASGEEEELYTPTHTFFGFRYIEIETDARVEITGAEGEVLQSDLTETGSFECGNPEVNKLYENILWGMRSNYISVPTDCPQRDERLGRTGDAQIFSGAACYLADIRSFMRKWLGDCRCSQSFTGEYGPVVPRVWQDREGGAAWADAGIIIPYKLYQMYGERGIIEEHWDSMEKYMEFLKNKKTPGPEPVYGDRLSYENTKKEYISLCYYAYDALIMAQLAKALNKPNREEHYFMLRFGLINTFKELYTDKGEITEKTQTGYLLPLAFGMLSGSMRAKAIRRLEEKIRENGYKLSTGFVGTGLICQTLARVGLHGLCWSLLLQTENPSWLYGVRQGATTVWERWDSYTKEKGFGDAAMNSFNHYACGAVAEWLFADAAGIAPEKPGFDGIILKPSPDLRENEEIPKAQERVSFVKAAYDSISGRIESSWQRSGDRLTYIFAVPEGRSAQVMLPEWGNFVLCGGKRIAFEKTGGRFIFRLGAGKHTVICEKIETK